MLQCSTVTYISILAIIFSSVFSFPSIFLSLFSCAYKHLFSKRINREIIKHTRLKCSSLFLRVGVGVYINTGVDSLKPTLKKKFCTEPEKGSYPPYTVRSILVL